MSQVHMKRIMRLKRVYKMISATAPPGMPIERGMVASWIPETSQPGSREYDKIMGCSARNADRPWCTGKQLPLGLSVSHQFKKNNIIQLQASGGGPDRSRKQQAKKVVDGSCGTC